MCPVVGQLLLGVLTHHVPLGGRIDLAAKEDQALAAAAREWGHAEDGARDEGGAVLAMEV